MYEIYTTKVNDTIDTIARELQITAEDIRKINGFSPNYQLTVGEQIIIPVTEGSYFNIYTVKNGDTLYSIARTYDMSVEDLSSLNGLESGEYIYPNQELLVPITNIDFYITKDGDTIRDVVEILKTSLEDMFRVNPRIYLVQDQLIVKEKEEN